MANDSRTQTPAKVATTPPAVESQNTNPASVSGAPAARSLRYLVPPEMGPGVYRQDVGFYRPGDELALPDAASVEGEVYPPKLVPLDAASRDILLRMHPKAKIRAVPTTAEVAEVKAAKKAADKPQTITEFAGAETGTKRAADQ
jgi:hypothetical protein